MKKSRKVMLWTLAKMVGYTGRFAQWILNFIRRDMTPPPNIVRRMDWASGDQHKWDVLTEENRTPTGKIGGSGVVQVACTVCCTECTRDNFASTCPGPPDLHS